ncbi:MAG: HAD family hydrolase [Planctomycetota bacterium]
MLQDNPQEPRRFRWVFLDAFGTLFDHSGVLERVARVVHRRERLTVPPEDFYKTWAALSREQMAARWHTEPFRTVRQWFSESLRSAFDFFHHAGDVEAGTELNMREIVKVDLFPDARPALAELARSYSVAIVSNIDRREMLELLEARHVSVPLVVTSEDARAYKPDPAFFRYALARARACPTEVVHVGDSLDLDVAGARLARVTPVWLNRSRTPAPPDLPSPPCSVPDLSSLAPLLRSLAPSPSNGINPPAAPQTAR